MTRLGIRFEEVEQIADKILADGQNPTIEKIRFVLGTGSNSTIAKYLHEWRSKRLIASTHEISGSNSPPDPVHAAVNRVWEQIREETATEIKSFREKAENEVQAANKERDDETLKHDKLLQEFDDLQKQYDELATEKELLTLDLKSQKQEHLLSEERRQALESQYQLLQRQSNIRIQDLKEQHKTEKDHFKKQLHLSQISYEQRINEWITLHENERHRHIVELDSFKVEQQKNQKRIEQVDLLNKNLNIELAELKATFAAAALERDHALSTNSIKEKIIADQKTTLSAINSIYSKMQKWNDAIVIKLNDIQLNISDQKLIPIHLENTFKTQIELLLSKQVNTEIK